MIPGTSRRAGGHPRSLPWRPPGGPSGQHATVSRRRSHSPAHAYDKNRNRLSALPDPHQGAGVPGLEPPVPRSAASRDPAPLVPRRLSPGPPRTVEGSDATAPQRRLTTSCECCGTAHRPYRTRHNSPPLPRPTPDDGIARARRRPHRPLRRRPTDWLLVVGQQGSSAQRGGELVLHPLVQPRSFVARTCGGLLQHAFARGEGHAADRGEFLEMCRVGRGGASFG